MFIGEEMAKLGAALRYVEFSKPASELTSWREELHPPLFVPGLTSLFAKGLSRGVIAEIHGRRSSGRTSVALHVLVQGTGRGEVCAVIDLHNGFDPAFAAEAGVQLNRLVWVRCSGNAAHAMRVADLLLHAGGFGVVLLDLCEASAQVLNRIPLSYWYRFRRAVEQTPTILLVCADRPQAKCSASSLGMKRRRAYWSGIAPFLLLRGIEVHAAEVHAVFRSATAPLESLAIRTA